jgi:hypothetical protein
MCGLIGYCIGSATGAFLVWVFRRNRTRELQQRLRFAILDYDLKRIHLGLPAEEPEAQVKIDLRGYRRFT